MRFSTESFARHSLHVHPSPLKMALIQVLFEGRSSLGLLFSPPPNSPFYDNTKLLMSFSRRANE
jgi:hypothetical protein